MDSLALYMRVSKEEVEKDESNSITTQRDLLRSYIKNNTEFQNFQITEFYDDGVSGSSFERPQFQKMLKELKLNKISCVVVKDFSRFGRTYIETSDFIEQVFPFMGVRFISVNEKFDSYNNTFNIEEQFKALTNDFYLTQLSNNIKKSLKTKMLNGTFLSAMPLFGYKVVKDKIRKWEIDEESAKIVRRIFEMVSVYEKPLKIAQDLNNENIPTPSIYKKRKTNTQSKNNFWRPYMIYSIIYDERYKGIGILNKTRKVKIGGHKVVKIPKEEWIIKPNLYPAIITEELYNKCIHCLKYPINNDKPAKRQRVFYSKIKCNCCGYTMKRSSSRNIKYYCDTPKYKTSPYCVSDGILEQDIENVIIKLINIEVDKIKEKEYTKEILKKRFKAERINVNTKIKQLEISQANIKNEKLKNYELFKEERKSKEDFQKKKQELDEHLKRLAEELEECKVVLSNKDNEEGDLSINSTLYNLAIENKHLTELTRQLVDELIEDVIIYDNTNCEVVWKFKGI